MIGEHVLAGYAHDGGGREALHLARAIVALTGGRLTVATVHPPDRPGAAGEARALLDQAAAVLGDQRAELVVQEGRGVGRGLTALASRIGADLIVVGSGAGGARGRIGIGATADHLLHSATEAVMLPPLGYEPPDALAGITVMYVRRPQADEAVTRAAQAAERLGVPLRLITLAVGDVPTGGLQDDLALAIRLALDSSGLESGDVSASLAEGGDVAEAVADIDWPEGEILVCASSEDASVHRVFLGEVALKVARAAPCPVTVLPRGYF
ncbi:universal stress protein [Actinomadura xylanilytica]|uniref:universal stress protein n=1 Tax=Actinomadura xylanilytica TaxID=887459 RepID=UPI00255B22B8|nr:universal stress protein [Actinomadura xylanilytica]MDL4774338.1 universal stress protein [Actinomadura xylanilytica]